MHLFLPTDGESLTGLASGIVEVAILKVGLAEVGKVDEGDATEVETHEEGIACEGFFGCEVVGGT